MTLQENRERFDLWMRNTVKNWYYSNDERMCNAYERVE